MNYLSAEFIDDVYNTLQGELIPEACIPGIENLFADGSPCDLAYTEMHDAYERLLLRLNKQDDDKDIETMICAFMSISKHLGIAMYLYGAKFALQASQLPSETDIQNRVP